MGRRTKQVVKGRAKAHSARVKAGHRRRVRAKSRGYHPLSKRRKMKAARRAKRR